MENKKTSQLVFDARVARKLLKKNGQIRFCPFCGKAIDEGCSCSKNFVIDIKKKRLTENESIFVFDNNEQFKADYEVVSTELKKKDSEMEQSTIDCSD